MRRKHGSAAPKDSSVEDDFEEPKADSHAGCDCGKSGLPRLDDCIVDGLEALTMTLVRHFMVGACNNHLQVWDHAYAVAEAVVSPVNGPLLVARSFALCRAMRAERYGDYRFMPIGCRHVSEDEMELLAALQSFSSGDPGLQGQAMLAFARRTDAPGLALATELCARLIGMMSAMHVSKMGETTRPDVAAVSLVQGDIATRRHGATPSASMQAQATPQGAPISKTVH
jgi:hypothetical protein